MQTKEIVALSAIRDRQRYAKLYSYLKRQTTDLHTPEKLLHFLEKYVADAKHYFTSSLSEEVRASFKDRVALEMLSLKKEHDKMQLVVTRAVSYYHRKELPLETREFYHYLVKCLQWLDVALNGNAELLQVFEKFLDSSAPLTIPSTFLLTFDELMQEIIRYSRVLFTQIRITDSYIQQHDIRTIILPLLENRKPLAALMATQREICILQGYLATAENCQAYFVDLLEEAKEAREKIPGKNPDRMFIRYLFRHTIEIGLTFVKRLQKRCGLLETLLKKAEVIREEIKKECLKKPTLGAVGVFATSATLGEDSVTSLVAKNP